MTHRAISAVLDYLYNEATMSTGGVRADLLLRTIDDVRVLVSRAPAPAGTSEEFDLVRCARAIVDVLNLASGRRVNRVGLDAPSRVVPVMQDRKLVEQLLTRVLGSALKLTEESDTALRVGITAGQNRVQMAIAIGESGLAERLGNWLNANPENVLLQNPGDIPFGLTLMVAGRWLRAMGGEAGCDGHAAVWLDLPSHRRGAGVSQMSPDALNVLVAEDNDESFLLTETALGEEQVWRARDGQEALLMVQKQRFDVIFMDIHMPGMSGYEVIRSMRDWETRNGCARTPMVVLSSDDVETQQRSAAEFGCSGFLRKPLAREEVSQLLDALK